MPRRVPALATWSARRRAAAPWISAGLVIAWGLCLAALLSGRAPGAAGLGAAPWIAAQTWLHTGLFIVAHDAIHGSAAPGSPRLNELIGRLALALYALFGFDGLRRAHALHHAHPGGALDPDGPGASGERFARWYARFVGGYLRWWQVAGLAAAFNVAHHALGVPEGRLLAFWVAPSLLSTLQLFAFGTWLPHRTPPGGFADAHRATSARWGRGASLLACFHFDFHWEHHAWPGVPWWLLGVARDAGLAELVDAEHPVGAEDRDAADAPRGPEAEGEVG